MERNHIAQNKFQRKMLACKGGHGGSYGKKVIESSIQYGWHHRIVDPFLGMQ